MPLTSNAFTFHDNSNSEISTSPDLISARPRRSTRSSSNAKLVFHFPAQTDATGMADGTRPLTVTAGRKSKPMRRRAAASNIDSDADDDLVSLIQNQNGHSRTVALPTRSRHKKAHSKSKSKDLAVDIAAANKAAMKTSRAARANGSGMGAIKEHVTDWEIPRKVLHSSIGFLTIYLYTSQTSPTPVIYALCSALIVIVPGDFLRLKWPGPGSGFARLYERFLGFLMRESEKKTTNGVIWYILGVGFALAVYPLDIAVVSILILSWADTAASTFGRLYGSSTPPLPPQTPLLRLPLAPRKSSAGFVAATLTGTLIAVSFYRWLGPLRPQDLSWTFKDGVRALQPGSIMNKMVKDTLGKWGWQGVRTGGWVGLSIIGVVAGLVAGVAEALDLGSLDDNLTLPVISGGCLWGFFKLMSLFSS